MLSDTVTRSRRLRSASRRAGNCDWLKVVFPHGSQRVSWASAPAPHALNSDIARWHEVSQRDLDVRRDEMRHEAASDLFALARMTATHQPALSRSNGAPSKTRTSSADEDDGDKASEQKTVVGEEAARTATVAIQECDADDREKLHVAKADHRRLRKTETRARSTSRRSAAGAIGSEATTKPVGCNALLDGCPPRPVFTTRSVLLRSTFVPRATASPRPSASAARGVADRRQAARRWAT